MLRTEKSCENPRGCRALESNTQAAPHTTLCCSTQAPPPRDNEDQGGMSKPIHRWKENTDRKQSGRCGRGGGRQVALNRASLGAGRLLLVFALNRRWTSAIRIWKGLWWLVKGVLRSRRQQREEGEVT